MSNFHLMSKRVCMSKIVSISSLASPTSKLKDACTQTNNNKLRRILSSAVALKQCARLPKTRQHQRPRHIAVRPTETTSLTSQSGNHPQQFIHASRPSALRPIMLPSSRPIPSHPIPSHLVPSYPNPSHIPDSNPSHAISPHPITSHRVMWGT